MSTSDTAAMAMTERPILECVNVAKSFGGVHAVKDMSLVVPANQIVALIGPNGAGKTTLFNCLTGLQPRDAGEIRFRGRPVPARSLQEVARLGIVRTFQNIRMFPGMTVYESLLAAQTARLRSSAIESVLGLPRHRREWRAMMEKAEQILVTMGLVRHRNSKANALPLLLQRKTEIARALATEPEVLLLDEPTAGATVSEAEELITVMRELKQRGLTILLIEHNMRLVMKVSDLVNVMNFGSLLASGTPDEIKRDERVRAVYLGSRA